MKQTSVEHIGRSQLIPSVRRTDAARALVDEMALPLSIDGARAN
jgi:hypothetical protein